MDRSGQVVGVLSESIVTWNLLGRIRGSQMGFIDYEKLLETKGTLSPNLTTARNWQTV